MEIVSYISSTDGFTHYLITNSFNIPFELWIILVGSSISFIYLVLKKIIG